MEIKQLQRIMRVRASVRRDRSPRDSMRPVFGATGRAARHPTVFVLLVSMGLLAPAPAQDPVPRTNEPKSEPDRTGAEAAKEPDVGREADELGKRLLRKAASESDEDVMTSTLRLMSESERRLAVEFDAGDRTQEVQSDILSKLNNAIKAAGKRRLGRGGQPNWTSDRRRSDAAPKPQQPPDPSRRRSGTGASDDETTRTPVAPDDVKPVHGDLQETRRTWGLLPQRERDEMIQGSSEGFMERYREWIERYYRALQESGE